MPKWITGLFGGLIRSGALALARHLATGSGVALLSYLISHHVGADLAQQLVLDFQDALLTVTGIGLTAAGVGTSLKDVKSVNAKMAAAAAAGYDKGQAQAIQQAMQQGAEIQASADTGKIAAVAGAMKEADQASKQDKASLVAALKSGSF